MLKEAAARLKALGAKEIYLHAQTRARAFYEKQGYLSLEEYDDEEGVPHVWMKLLNILWVRTISRRSERWAAM